MKKLTGLLLSLTLAGNLAAQLTTAQREQDFLTLAGVFAKRYAPANWKIQALNANLFQVSPWLDKIRAARTDLEFLEICAQYVSSLQDGHAQFIAPGNFLADLGFYTDLYDDRLLIDFIDRTLLPARDYPFAVGDELVSLDGRPAKDVMNEFAKLHTYANPRYSLRIAADALTYRRQSDIPSAGLLGATARVQIRRQGGAVEDYTIPWYTEGTQITKFGALPGFFGRESQRGRENDLLRPNEGTTEIPLWQKTHDRFKRWSLREENDPLRRGRKFNLESGAEDARRYYLGYGSVRPVWDLPSGFVIRQGRNSSDYFLTGTYQSEGKRIGYMRIGAFDTLSTGQTQLLDAEINFFNANTDGLVVDVMRNPGGGCSLATIAQRLMSAPTFTHFSETIRPTFDQVAAYDEIISLLEVLGAPTYLLELYRFERKQLLDALQDGRGLTGAVPACFFDLTVNSSPNSYKKPLILLVDDFSTSAADIFAGIIQDNNRGKLVGTRTSGAGGRVELVSAGPYSEALTTNTASLVIRAKDYQYPGFPSSPYIENVGVRPDIELDYMTAANLAGRGAPFVAAFTRIILDEINRATP